MRHFLIVCLFFSGFVYGQHLPDKNGVFSVIQASVIPDFYYFLDLDLFDKKDTPKLYFSDEVIDLNTTRFQVKLMEENAIEKKQFSLQQYGESFEDAHFIVFGSDITAQKVMFEVYFKRAAFYNIPNSSEYEYWRRMNGGICYFFEFDEDHKLLRFDKKRFSYD